MHIKCLYVCFFNTSQSLLHNMVLVTFLQALKKHKDAVIILGTIGTGLLVGGFLGGVRFASYHSRESEIRQEVV